MIGKLIEEVKKWIPQGPPAFDPASLNDPVAMKAEWRPLKPGGTNIRTHGLAKLPDGRMAFKPAPGMLLFGGVFVAMGLGIGAVIAGAALREGRPVISMEVLMPILFGLVFAGVGGGLLGWAACPVIIDRQTKLAWKGWRNMGAEYDRGGEARGALCKLDEVHAIQLLSEWVRGNKSSYTSYELNFVLKDGGRVNVVDHGDAKRIRLDAAELAAYLEVPVWDAIRS